jgi:hypothetical protein
LWTKSTDARLRAAAATPPRPTLALEALAAGAGDALLLHLVPAPGTAASPRLVLIDGGPPAVFENALAPRLEAQRASRGLSPGEPLEIDLALVGHLDLDHFGGLLELVRRSEIPAGSDRPPPWRIQRVWFNGFDELLGNTDPTVGTSSSPLGGAAIDGLLDHGASMLLASVPHARELRRRLAALGLAGNVPFGVVASGPRPPFVLDDLKLHVIAPTIREVAELRDDWRERIRPLLALEPTRARLTELAAFVERPLYGAASLVVLAECGGRRLLLTGDARGDRTLAALEAGGFLDRDGRIELDLLKLPRHGSERHVDRAYFERLRAKHYLISADGKHDHPDIRTLALLSEARPDDDFTIHLTYAPEEFAVPTIGRTVERFFAAERGKGRRYRVEAGSGGEGSSAISVSLS